MATEEQMQFTVKQGMNQDILKSYPDNHFDSIVTDPPYGIEFLGKDWDSNTGAIETWKECFRVLKPGGHLLAFSAARTYHHLATNIENTGFEIRDQLMWIYASGFPKAQDIGKALDKRGIDNEWSGWKTALKPGHEPIVMARKPFKGSTIDNVLKHGTGALNIDATRISLEAGAINQNTKVTYNDYSFGNAGEGNKQNNLPPKFNPDDKGRFPSNVLGEITDYQKYFYCPKVSRAERHCGFEQNNIPTGNNIGDGVYAPGTPGSLDHIATSNGGFLGTDGDWASEHWNGDKGNKNNDTVISTEHMIQAMGGKLIANNRVWTPDLGEFYIHGLKEEYIKWCKKNNKATGSMGNNHPTVKPVALMRYLVELVTPKGGKVLDPFTGSGSTGMAAVEASMCFTGCELDPNYVAIANKRIEAWYTRTQPDNNFKDLFDATE